jgi:DnaJ-class molecular chaperone
MSHLVYCPTCNGKMSVNAKTCPHCGENTFYTPGGNLKCFRCLGKGLLTGGFDPTGYYWMPRQCELCKGTGRVYDLRQAV